MSLRTTNSTDIVTSDYILGLYLEHVPTSGTPNYPIKDARIIIPDPTNAPNMAELWIQWNIAWVSVSPEVRIILNGPTTYNIATDREGDANTAPTSPPSTGIVLSPNHSSIANLASKLTTARTISLGGSLSGSTTFDGSADVTINASINAGAIGIPTPALVTGLRVCPFAITSTATGTLTMTTNTSYWIPFAVNRRTTVSTLSIDVSTASSGSSETVGIYNSNQTNLYPQALLGSVTLDTSSTGLKTGTSATAITLTPGLYWIAIASNGAPTLTAIDVGSLLPLAYSGTSAVTHYRNTGTTLPSTAPTTGYTAGTEAFPLVLLTISF
jgi:hypothetical protein